MIPLGVLGGAHHMATLSPSLITDTFTRADNASSIGSTETGGQAWQTIGATWGINNGQAYVPAFSSRASATVELGATSMRVAARMWSGGGYPFIAAGYADIDNTYQLVLTSTVGQVTRRVNGANTTLYNIQNTALIDEGYLLEMLLDNTSPLETVITVSINGVVFDTRADSTANRPLGTRAGIALPTGTPASRWDDFEAEAL